MSECSSALVAALLAAAVADNTCTGAAAAFGRYDEVRMMAVSGTTSGPHDGPVTERTLWDLASLTKVLVTVPAVLRLTQRAGLPLQTPLADILPSLANRPVAAATLAELLSHTSGLPADAPPIHANVLKLVESCQVSARRQVLYSDVGYLALGEVIRVLHGGSLAAALRTETVEPLGLPGPTVWFGSVAHGMGAATEHDAPGGTQLVHDPTARRLGGLGGHAGMFASLPSVLGIVGGWLRQGNWLPTRSRTAALTSQTEQFGGGRRGWGWCLPGDDFHCAGAEWGPEAVSHTGFTGTSVVMEPNSGHWAVLLTNAIPQAAGVAPIVRLRRGFNALAAGHLRLGSTA